MSQRIPQDFVQELLARADIVEVIERRIKLKKNGSNYSACCPFHQEKTPSFTVSQTKQFYHCFGCGAHDNAIGFLMAYDRLEFVEAVEELAHHLGIPMPTEVTTQAPASSQQPLYALLDKIAHYYQTQLQHNEKAQAYLRARGLDEATVKRFGIGLAPAGWDHVLREFGNSNATNAQLMQVGMLIKNDQGKVYDRFRERLMIPIRDQRGRVIAFGGRTLGDDTPKYLNSPETPLFYKGSELFGLYEARQSKASLDPCVVVEGYMDVIALHQHGITTAVATMGTSTTSKHLQRLFRYTKQVLFCFDGDNAGREAAWRALENTLPVMDDSIQIRFMFLPQNLDPDNVIRREGKAGFERYMAQAIPLSDFLFERFKTQVTLDTPDGKAKLVQLMKEPLHKIPTGVFHELMVQRLANLVGMRLEALQPHLAIRQPAKSESAPDLLLTTNQALLPPIQLAIAIILQYPQIIQQIIVPQQLNTLQLAGSTTLLLLLQQLKANPQLSTGGLLEHWRASKHIEQLAKLAAWKLITPPHGLDAELQGALYKTIHQDREERIQALIAKSNIGELSGQEKTHLLQLLKERH